MISSLNGILTPARSLSERAGKIKFKDIIKDVTVREEIDDQTGLSQLKIIEQSRQNPVPDHSHCRAERLRLWPATACRPTLSCRYMTDKKLHPGDHLVKMPRIISKSRDITGGLPRVAELFEARRPHDPAVITEVDGSDRVRQDRPRPAADYCQGRGRTRSREYLVPHGKHMMVHDGDQVQAGDRLCEGSVDPHDILKIWVSTRCRRTW